MDSTKRVESYLTIRVNDDGTVKIKHNYTDRGTEHKFNPDEVHEDEKRLLEYLKDYLNGNN